MKDRYVPTPLSLFALFTLRYNQTQDSILHAGPNTLLNNWLRERESTVEITNQTLRKENTMVRLQVLRSWRSRES
jgi:hypothetical protein